MKWKMALPILLTLSLMLLPSFCEQAQGQAQHSLGLEGFTWNHSTISVLVVPQAGVSGWKPSYLNATQRAIDEWNNAFHDFALNYSNFAYLSRLRMIPTVSQAMNYSFDVYVSWTEALTASSGEIGLTQTAYDSSGTIINSTITLSVKDSHGYVINDIDMQNVALHELGHSLGLDHSNYSGDVMYPLYTPNQPILGLSTLDLYGVSTVFQWMSNPSNSPYRPQQSSVTLPLSIPYQYLPISYGKLLPPTQSPIPPVTLSPELSQTLLAFGQTLLASGQILLTHIIQFFLLPEISIPLLIAISALLATKFLVARINHKSAQKERLN